MVPLSLGRQWLICGSTPLRGGDPRMALGNGVGRRTRREGLGLSAERPRSFQRYTLQRDIEAVDRALLFCFCSTGSRKKKHEAVLWSRYLKYLTIGLTDDGVDICLELVGGDFSTCVAFQDWMGKFEKHRSQLLSRGFTGTDPSEMESKVHAAHC